MERNNYNILNGSNLVKGTLLFHRTLLGESHLCFEGVMKEEWKDIQGFEGLYKISNSGKVKSNKRNVPHKRHGNLFVRERILSATPDSSGYLQVAICKNCKRY